jgi:hypothetical protein
MLIGLENPSLGYYLAPSARLPANSLRCGYADIIWAGFFSRVMCEIKVRAYQVIVFGTLNRALFFGPNFVDSKC